MLVITEKEPIRIPGIEIPGCSLVLFDSLILIFFIPIFIYLIIKKFIEIDKTLFLLLINN